MMSSPLEIYFKGQIKIDRRKRDPLYLQLVYQFINLVKMNFLEVGDRLPGSRVIAEELGLHRKTVVSGLEELKTQGWIFTKPGVGTYVQNPEQATKYKNRRHNAPPKAADFVFKRNFILDQSAGIEGDCTYFTDGIPDYRAISSNELARFYTSVLKRKRTGFTTDTILAAHRFFKKQLSYYLNITRGFHLSKDFILPIKSREQLYHILAQLLVSTGDVVLVEEFSHFLPNMLFGQAGARLKTIPMDEDGIQVDYIRTHFQKGAVRLLYLNPLCQYPTTWVLSKKRGKELLQLAEEMDFLIVEDGFDYEFSNGKKRTPLFFEDGGKRVLYTGIFGGFLAPDFQMNFLVGPADFVEEGRKYLQIFEKSHPVMERALGEMISEGDIHRYRRKAQRLIAQRKVHFDRLLQRYFGEEIDYKVPENGLAFWIVFKKDFPLAQLAKRASENGLSIPRICRYQQKGLTALRLGFASLDEREMEAAVRILAEAYFDQRGHKAPSNFE